MKEQTKFRFAELLDSVLTKPGKIADCYRMFHDYSFGNQIMAMFQASARGLELSPIATYKRWQELGRQVKKGEKAITLCMPIIIKDKEAKEEEKKEKMILTWRNLWFFLSQTDGEEIQREEPQGWDYKKVLTAYGIKETSFKLADGNTQGYAAEGNEIAINPLAGHYWQTMIHEIAHTILEHRGSELTKEVKELEAEAVAYLCINALDLPGAEESRGYIQHWYKGKTIEEASAKRILTTADKILKAGTKE